MATRPSIPVLRRTLAAVTVLVLALTGWTGDAPDGADNAGSGPPHGGGSAGFRVVEDGLDPALTEALNRAGREAFAGISAPGAIMAVRTPRGTWVAATGATEWGGSTPMAADMHQRVGSITKTFTVTALLQLAERGELSLDDPIGRYVEGMPNPEATLAQLAEMRSGIPSYTFDEGFQARIFGDPTASWTPEELVDVVRGQPPNFAPGTQTEYSNTNTILLGLVIEEVTGKAIEDVVHEQIVEPLGLTGTVFPTDTAFAEPHAHGYTLQGQDGRVPADATGWSPTWGWAAGAMISTLDDILHYGRELVAGDTLLSPDMQRRRLESFDFAIPPNTPARAYGLGLTLANGWYGHDGELPGYNTYMEHHLATDTTVVVMVNSDIPSGACPPDAPTVPGGRTEGPCEAPGEHITDALTAALGHPMAAPEGADAGALPTSS